jgi:hypothetical protein
MSTNPVALVPSGTVTASGNSGPLELGPQTVLDLEVLVTAVSGTTPSMTLSVQWSNDGVNFGPTDAAPDSFAAITAAETVAKQVTVKGLWAQIVWTITGTTPSFTFTVIAS